MTGTISPVCAKCGAEIREGSLYCYGCGSPVAEVSSPSEEHAVEDPIEVQERDLTAELEEANTAAAESTSAPAALARRRRPRPEPKTVEVVWAEPEGNSLVFILGSGILILLAGVLVLLALYLK